MDVNSLLDQAKEACGVSYDKDLAPRLGVRPSAISNYRKGVSHPDAVVCATLAGLTGVPLARVLGVIGEARAISREEKAVWRKLAATAMALCLAVGFALPHKAQAAVMGFDKSTVYTLCEMPYRSTAAAWQLIDVEQSPPLQQTFASTASKVGPIFAEAPQESPRSFLYRQELVVLSAVATTVGALLVAYRQNKRYDERARRRSRRSDSCGR